MSDLEKPLHVIMKEKHFTSYVILGKNEYGDIENSVFITKNPHSKLKRLFDEDAYVTADEKIPLNIQKALLRGHLLNWVILFLLVGFNIIGIMGGSSLVFLNGLVSGFVITTAFIKGKKMKGSYYPAFFHPDIFAQKYPNLSLEEREPLIDAAIQEELVRDESAYFVIRDEPEAFMSFSEPDDMSLEGAFVKYIFAQGSSSVDSKTEDGVVDAFSAAVSYHSARRKWDNLRKQNIDNENVFRQMEELSQKMIDNENAIKKSSAVMSQVIAAERENRHNNESDED